MRIRENKEVPHNVQHRMEQLIASLPSNKTQREEILARYQAIQGYEFLDHKSKAYRFFKHKLRSRFQFVEEETNSQMHQPSQSSRMDIQTDFAKHNHFFQTGQKTEKSMIPNSPIEQQVRVNMIGNLSDISVGGMCQVVKDYMRQECPPYFPAPNQSFLQEFTYSKDKELSDKVNRVFNSIKLTILEASKQKNLNQSIITKNQSVPTKSTAINKMGEFRKEMTVSADGSLGSWGGKKYEGLGTRDEFSNFRREKSQNYYQNSAVDKKK